MEKRFDDLQNIRPVAGLFGLALSILLAGTACTKTYSTATDHSAAPTQATQSLLDYLRNNYAFSIFYAGLHKTGLDTALRPDGKFTLLVPDNDAFGRAGISLDSVMRLSNDTLRNWLGFHIIQGAIGYDSVPQTVDNAYFSILGQKIFFSRPIPGISNAAGQGHILHINGTQVNNFDIPASNGFIQVLNNPLNAPLKGNLQDYFNTHLDQYSLFKACLQHFNLWDDLKNDTDRQLTVFAPVNASFQDIPIYYQQQNLFYTITPDTIAAWDTAVIPQAVFGVCRLPSRIFTSDFTDAPTNSGPGGQYASYIFPDLSGYVNLGIGSPVIQAVLLSPYQRLLKAANAGMILSPGNFITTNGNNVVQPIDHVLLIP